MLTLSFLSACLHTSFVSFELVADLRGSDGGIWQRYLRELISDKLPENRLPAKGQKSLSTPTGTEALAQVYILLETTECIQEK